MAWPGERRFPPNWNTLRAQVFTRDGHRCTMCGSNAQLECDHINDAHDHTLANLRTLCKTCHTRRTTEQATQARGAGPLRKRPTEPHPGIR